MESRLESIKNMLRKKAHIFAKKIQPIYQYLHWTWRVDELDENHVPSVATIEKTLNKLIDQIDIFTTNISSGGLMINVERQSNDLYISMSFIYEEEFVKSYY